MTESTVDLTAGPTGAEQLTGLFDRNGIHTVELAVVDTQGHLRGKRIPVKQFLDSTVRSGANIADAIFVFDIKNNLSRNEFINMGTGYPDIRIVPDFTTLRLFRHRPGYALVFGSAQDKHGTLHPLAPRTILANQVRRCTTVGLDPVVATEMEFYLVHPDGTPVMDYVQYSSLTCGDEFELALHEIRDALAGVGMPVEGSNLEFGTGQMEINVGPADAMRTADNTVLYKSIVKQIAARHGWLATFMAKPFAGQSGSGMHIHTSLNVEGANGFASSDGAPNELMSQWLAGLLEHAAAMTIIGVPNANSMKRIRPYTLAPTHIHWGGDNRTVLARCLTEAGSAANRVEFRSAGANANPYLIIAAALSAGADGVERGLDPGPKSEGDMYTNPGSCQPLPTTVDEAVAAYGGSLLAGRLGDMFSRSYLSLVRADAELATAEGAPGDDVNDWERARYMEHS
ncbi:MAG: glutamine synthetase family protein [Acidimicrobiia bacterium]|nr:glutamine synthetase family protein [Acidimicrobiia bacterium]